MVEEKKKRKTEKKEKTALRYAKKLVQHGNKELAAKQCGLAPKYGYQIAKQPEFLTALQTVLDEEGLNDLVIAQTIKKGLDAYYVRKDGGQEYPDFHAIDKALTQLIKIKGGYAAEKTEHIEKRMIFNVTPETIKAMRDCAIPEEEIEVLVSPEEDSNVIDAEIVTDKEDKKEVENAKE